MQEVYEKLGLFYLGKDIDKETNQASEALTLLKNKNFTTHAAIIGMTGSGKTGLGIGLIEEAALDNIPSIVIDPKGDMGNLCLTDPIFHPKSFEPWVADEAATKQVDVTTYATETAQMWQKGIEDAHQSSERVAKLHQIKKTIYTPGSSAGVPINVMSSLQKPSSEVMEDSDTFASYLKSTVVSLLALVGIEADPLDSKEYMLLAQVLSSAWLQGESLTIESLIGKVIAPPFDTIGVLRLEEFFDKKERFALASKFNALLASPSFSLWLEGDTFDIQKLLYDENGKAKISIFSIAHLNDEERMFFVTLLLNKYTAWMRRQSGTAALKTLLYMDEIYGFFPPTKNPPSKEPMLLLLKQARAFGVGVVLSTQNPVDLDYKGLSNIGTWFIGRLQTTQDIDRVIDGLGGKVGASFDKGAIRPLLANLEKRTFFLKSAHLDGIKLFSTRWVLSYLKGPLKRDEISTLMQAQKEAQNIEKQPIETLMGMQGALASYQDIDESIVQYFEPDLFGKHAFYPTLGAKAEVHFYNQRRGIDIQKEFQYSLVLDPKQQVVDWSEAREEVTDFEQYPHAKPSEASYQPLPEVVLDDRGLKKASKVLTEKLYRDQALTLYRCDKPKVESEVGESHADFLVRIQDLLNEKKEEEIEKLKERYGKREKTLLNRLERAKERVEKEESDSTGSMVETGIAIIGALFGRSSPSKIGRAISKGSRVLKERGDMSRAKERMVAVEDDIEALGYELEDKVEVLNQKYTIEQCTIEEFSIKPRKSDVFVKQCAVVWRVMVT
jgi:hypothetical protein